MSKTFDSVDHQILLRKLQDVGASTSVLQWFNSYLTNRYQVVRIHSTVSNPISIECGVPQGSILGPLLFSIYVNDPPEAPRNCSTECFIDDTKLFVSFHSQDTQRIVEEMNEDLLGVRNWCFKNCTTARTSGQISQRKIYGNCRLCRTSLVESLVARESTIM